MKYKEEIISKYNGSGHIDLTPYQAVLNIVEKERQEKKYKKSPHNKVAQKTSKKMQI